ncbi:MAG: amino acid ABC transporter substrate-binding protein [Desulfobulbus propionicus]|nr:MAG: amino acid ABC transporter substrate-binding protein [Desulfobulbus propionicus]
MKLQKKRMVLVLLFLLIVAAWAQAQDIQRQLVESSTIEQIIKRGKIRVGMDVFVPWAMKDKNGKLVGFEIDVAQQLAEDMGIAVEFVPTKWSGIIPALISGKFDVIIGGMSVNPKRNMKINFTRPYYYTSQGVLANRKLTEGLALADFNKPGVTIAARLGSTAAIAAKKEFPAATIRLFDDEPAAVQEVKNGRVMAMVSSQPLPNHMAADAPETLKSFSEQLNREPICFGVRKGDPDTLNFFNNWIETVTSKGWIDERYAYWFESTEWKNRIK